MKNIFTVLFLFISSLLYGGMQPSFRHLNSSHGLSSNYTNCFLKDHRGFLWIGTNDGLNCFYGKNVVVFKHSINDPNSLRSNDILSICEDSRGKIWIASRNCLSVFDVRTDKFTNYLHLDETKKDSEMVKGLNAVVFFNNRIWIGLNKSLAYTDVDKINFKLVKKEKLHCKKGKIIPMINGMYADKNGLWVNTIKGIFYTKTGDDFYNKEYNPFKWEILSRGYLPTFRLEGDSVIWFCTWEYKGFYRYSLRANRTDSIPVVSNRNLNFLDICRVSDEKIWGCTINDGIVELNTKTHETSLFMPERSNPNSVSDLEIHRMYKDMDGTVFLATMRGVDFTSPVQNQFTTFGDNPRQASLPDDIFTSIDEDDSGFLWVGTQNSGLYKMKASGQVAKHYNLPEEENSNIWLVQYDEGVLWVCTQSGLMTFDIESGKFSRIKNLPKEVDECLSYIVNSFVRDSKGNYWFALFGNGILRYNFSTKKFIHITDKSRPWRLSENFPQFIVKDEKGMLWTGLYKHSELESINPDDLTITSYPFHYNAEGSGNGPVMGIEFDKTGKIWVGTYYGGLYTVDPGTRIIKQFGANVLSSNLICNVIKDKHNDIWVFTANGLNRIESGTGKINTFYTTDGLPSNQFTDNVCFMSKKGIIYFGCNHSLLNFDPQFLKLNPHIPKISLISYEKSGTRFSFSPDEKEINLSYRDKAITFEFTGINFIDPDKNSYAYMLEGFDKNWTYSGMRSVASYTNLPGGNYILKLKATNKAGMWQVPELRISIQVSGPFWNTWWFSVLCLIAMTLLSYLVYYIRLRQILRLQMMRDRISRDLHDEVGSALSSISIYSEVAKKMSGDKAPEVIPIIQSLGESARTAMENMSDIVWAVNPLNDRFSNVIQRINIFGNQLFDPKDVKFHLKAPGIPVDMKLDMQQRKNLYLIFKEALVNIAKYAQASNCYIEIVRNNKFWNISIIDDGKGFDLNPDNLGGNGLVNMKKRALELKGIFNILSEKEKGTALTLQFEL